MAELTNTCCTPVAQETCCEPPDKASCCGESHDDGCGCSAGSVHTLTTTATVTVEHVRETVRQRYAAAAVAAASGGPCCGPADDAGLFGASLYADSSEGDAPGAAINASLSCGVPTAVADLHEAETVLDSGRARAPTSSSPPAGSAPPAGPSVWT
jgi:arsenite methyltransferase